MKHFSGCSSGGLLMTEQIGLCPLMMGNVTMAQCYSPYRMLKSFKGSITTQGINLRWVSQLKGMETIQKYETHFAQTFKIC